jgi:hypothetical protein
LFTYGQGQGVGSFDNPGFPKGIIDPTQFPADLYQAAEAAVASIADPILRQSALYDLLLTGDQSFVTSAANTSTTPQSESNDFGQTAPQLTSVGVSVLPISIVEGDTNSQDVTFTFWRTDGSSSLTMFYQLEGMVDAGDVEIGTPFSGSVAFADGETEKQVVVKVLGDEAIETDETLTASLVTTNLGSFLIASGKATTTIVNDDFPPLTINTIAGDDIINRSERAAGTAITGSIAGGSGIVEVQVTIGTGTQPPSKTGTVDSDGNWSINFTEQDLTPLGDGSFTVTAVGTTSGNVQTDPASRAILIDATAPGFPTINPVTGDNNIDATEKATGVEITGTAEANSTVRLKFGDAIRNLTAINGSWSAFIQPDELPNVETVTLTITATDAAGNQSNPATQAVTVAVINDITIDLEGDDYFIILTSGPPVSLKLENQQFTKTAAGDWEDLEAETINGQNQVLWRNSVTQQIGIWTTDDDWNYQSATVNPIESLQTLEAEVDFQVDINGDGILGDVREFVDTQGSTQLLKGIYGFYYVQTVDDIDNSVKYLGEPFNNYGYWQASAAEVIGDANQVLWKNSFTRQIGIWTTDDNWNYVSADVDPIRSLQTLKAEVDFQVDLNGDTKLGDHQVVIDEAGSVKLWQGIYGFYHVETETTDGLTSVKYQNEGFNDYGSWQALSAEVVDGLNQVLWQNLDTEEIGIWTTDDSWNYVSAAVSPIASDQTLKAEFDFQVDLNGDGIMSYTPTA